ncbi:MAG TPA: crosslink repair DNA glycosylase YcaQ family protein [Kofleriaceae bacterium]|nr:crosslink repair DNA glycosylase YcaQ family protein [Kofleriaceae bacterium]
MPSSAPRSSRRRPGRVRAAASELSARDARQIALAAQGLGDRPAKPTLRHVRGVFEAISLIQVDSVNVVCRSQELPLWSRLGAHARDALPALCERGVLFEYWAHEASLMPVELQPLLRWRMAEARDKAWRVVRSIIERDPGYVESVRAEVCARGPLTARDLEPRAPARKRASWWSWDDRKRALAYLFWAGEITALRSPTTFERIYAPLDRVLPARVLAARTPDPDEARRELLVRSARALGVATARDLADYFRIAIPIARPLVAELAAARRLIEVRVEGWREPAYLSPDAPAPGPVAARALLSPFDSLIWERRRTERLFGFRYRIEIYTPAHRRTHGYYVLPFLHGDALVARVDVKADRADGALRVHAAYAEPGAPPDTAGALAAELAAFAGWLGLPRVVVGRRGDLATPLREQLRGPGRPPRRSRR